MPKTQFADGLIVTKNWANAVTNPVYRRDPQNDGEIPYPTDLDAMGVSSVLSATQAQMVALASTVDTKAPQTGLTALQETVSAISTAVEACAATAGDNVFSGKNSFTKTLGFSVVSFGSSDSSSIPSQSLSKDSPAVFKLTGYGIIYCDFLTSGYPPVRCTVINTVNKGLSISGLDGTIRRVLQNGTCVDRVVVRDSMTGISDLAVELIWDGSVLNVISLSERQLSKSIGASVTLGDPEDLPRLLSTNGSSDHVVTLANPSACDGYACTILRGDVGSLALSWAFGGNYALNYWPKGGTSWVAHSTGFAASSSAMLFDVYSADHEWWIRES